MTQIQTIIDPDWITADVIKEMLSTRFKTREWDLGNVLNWSMEVETLYLVNVDSMVQYINVKLPVQNKMFRKPCNLYRLLDVYTNPNDMNSIVNNDTRALPSWVRLPQNYSLDYVYISYVGTPVDLKTGQPLININHRKACMFYCAMQEFMEDSLLGVFPPQSYAMLEQKFSEECYNADSIDAGRNMQRKDYINLAIIQGNMLPVIGSQQLYKDSMGE